MTLIQKIAQTLDALHRCIEWSRDGRDMGPIIATHYNTLRRLQTLLPSSSGIDNGTQILEGVSSLDDVKLGMEFHHMNADGYYTEWTAHTITCRPSFLGGLRLTISGPNRNGIKDYLHEVYDATLNSPYQDPIEQEAPYGRSQQ